MCFTGDGADEVFGGYSRHSVIVNFYNKNKNNDIIATGYNYHTVNRLKNFFKKRFCYIKYKTKFLR